MSLTATCALYTCFVGGEVELGAALRIRASRRTVLDCRFLFGADITALLAKEICNAAQKAQASRGWGSHVFGLGEELCPDTPETRAFCLLIAQETQALLWLRSLSLLTHLCVNDDQPLMGYAPSINLALADTYSLLENS